jgi:hypothetical protein
MIHMPNLTISLLRFNIIIVNPYIRQYQSHTNNQQNSEPTGKMVIFIHLYFFLKALKQIILNYKSIACNHLMFFLNKAVLNSKGIT